MTVFEFHEKQNVVTGDGKSFVSTPSYETKSTDLAAKTAAISGSLFVEPVVFGEAKSTDSIAIGFWTDARTIGRNFEKTIFQEPLLRLKFKKKRGRKERSRLLPCK